MTNDECTNDECRSFVIRHSDIRHSLAVDRREAPIGDHDFGARRHVADLAGDLDLLALGGLAAAAS